MSERTESTASVVTIEPLAAADLELLAPLWRALLAHIATLPGTVVPIRPFEQSWPLERQEMLEALEREAFILCARRGGDVIGYAYVAVEGPDPVWYTGDTRAELVHLSVAPQERGGGIGTALMDAVDAELDRRGICDVEIGVDAANSAAMRFYERRGYRSDFVIYYGSPGRRDWACLEREAADRAAERGRFAPAVEGAAEP